MKKLNSFFRFNKTKKKNPKTIDEFRSTMLLQSDDSIIHNNEIVVGGILEGRSPEFIDLTPTHTHRTINNEFDMLP